MDSQLHKQYYALILQKKAWDIFSKSISLYFLVDWTFFAACSYWNHFFYKMVFFYTWLSTLCALLVRCKHHWVLSNQRFSLLRWTYLSNSTYSIIGVRHALGTRLLQKCLRHSPPGVVCTQVWNLKELTEGHHKNAWSMWLNLTQRGKSYRVRTHWGLTGIL